MSFVVNTVYIFHTCWADLGTNSRSFLWLLLVGKTSLWSRWKIFTLLAHMQWPTETNVQVIVGKASASVNTVVQRGLRCHINNFVDSQSLIDNWYLSCIIVSLWYHWVQLYSLVTSIDFNQNLGPECYIIVWINFVGIFSKTFSKAALL